MRSLRKFKLTKCFFTLFIPQVMKGKEMAYKSYSAGLRAGFIRIFFYVILLLVLSCKDEPTKPEQLPQMRLTVEDVSCVEAWLRLTTANVDNPVIVLGRGIQ